VIGEMIGEMTAKAIGRCSRWRSGGWPLSNSLTAGDMQSEGSLAAASTISEIFPQADGRPFSMESDDGGRAPIRRSTTAVSARHEQSRCRPAAASEDAFEARSAAAGEQIFDYFQTREVPRTAQRVMEREMSPTHR
jgi:hypothetical protein